MFARISRRYKVLRANQPGPGTAHRGAPGRDPQPQEIPSCESAATRKVTPLGWVGGTNPGKLGTTGNWEDSAIVGLPPLPQSGFARMERNWNSMVAGANMSLEKEKD